MASNFRVSDEEIEDIARRMFREGRSKREIVKKLGISWSKLYRILGKESQQSQEGEQEGAEEITEEDGIDVPRSTDQEIINSASEMASKQNAKTLSEMIHRDYVDSIKAAKVLREAEMRYRTTLESWGWKWSDWLREGIEYAFKKTQEREKLEAIIMAMRNGGDSYGR